jgi:hypothetical protein
MQLNQSYWLLTQTLFVLPLCLLRKNELPAAYCRATQAMEQEHPFNALSLICAINRYRFADALAAALRTGVKYTTGTRPGLHALQEAHGTASAPHSPTTLLQDNGDADQCAASWLVPFSKASSLICFDSCTNSVNPTLSLLQQYTSQQ